MIITENDKIKQLLIDQKSSLLFAIKQMDETAYKLLIVYENKKFKSLVSIGDIQRAIIKGFSFETPIEKILRNNITVCFESESIYIIKKKMLSFRTEFMPILNVDKELLKVVFWKDIFKDEYSFHTEKLDIPVVIMAGGKGTRLKPITNVIPKALIPLGEKPILEEIMDKFTKIGVNEFFISVNYKAEIIENYFNSIAHPHYSISYFKEKKPLGTGGSLYLLKGQINSTFVVTNCDILIDQEYQGIYNYHKENNNELTIVSALKSYSIPYGTLEVIDGNLVALKEKPNLTYQVNTGMYILEPHLLDNIPENTFFHITELIDQIIHRKGKVGVYPVSEGSWKDVGEWNEYLKNSGINEIR